MLNKKCISPVVATALLIVVAVVSVVGFQTWFGGFSSGVFTKTETQSSNSVGNTQIDSVIGNSVYFENSGTENITITQVKVEGVDCNIATNATSGMSELDISSCLANVTTTTPEVVIYTDSGIYSEEFYVKTPVSASNLTTPSAFTGTMVWNRTYAGLNSDYAADLDIDSNDNIYSAGYIFNGMDNDLFLIKYDSDGNEIWNRSYDSGLDDYVNEMVIDSNDNIYLIGTLLVKYDSSGNLIFNTTTFDFISEALGIDVDSNDNIYFIGTNWNGLENDIRFFKYDSNGNEIWNRTYDSGFEDIAQAVAIDSNDNIYFVGSSQVDGGNYHYIIFKYNSSGSELLNFSYDDGNEELAYTAIIDTNDNLYVSGTIDVGFDTFVKTIKYDSSGNSLLNMSYNISSQTSVNDIKVDFNGNIFITGYIDGGDSYLLEYDSSGNEIWNVTQDSGFSDHGTGIGINSIGDIYHLIWYNDDFLTVKYS